MTFHCKQAIARHCNSFSAKTLIFKFKTNAQASLHILNCSYAVDTITLDIGTSHWEATDNLTSADSASWQEKLTTDTLRNYILHHKFHVFSPKQYSSITPALRKWYAKRRNVGFLKMTDKIWSWKMSILSFFSFFFKKHFVMETENWRKAPSWTKHSVLSNLNNSSVKQTCSN